MLPPATTDTDNVAAARKRSANKGKRHGDFPADSSAVIHERATTNIPRIMHKLQRSPRCGVADLDQGLARSEERARSRPCLREQRTKTRVRCVPASKPDHSRWRTTSIEQLDKVTIR
jgi:hypothetical protein